MKITFLKGKLVEFNVDNFKNNFTDKEWKIISFNMNKREILSNDPVENAKIKFLRA